MKTTGKYYKKCRHDILIVTMLFTVSMLSTNAQRRTRHDYLSLRRLPSGLTLKEVKPYSYEMITDYYNHDILGNFINKMQVRGIYTRGIENGMARWNDVTISQAQNLDQPFPPGKKQEYMEGLSYNPNENLLNLEAFKKFPMATGMFARNLIWDVLSFEVFSWTYYDSLQLNIPFTATKMNRKIDLDGMGSFENRDIQLTWTGVSTFNNKICAVIEFLALNNPLDIKTDFMVMKGRSHYWGTVWVSLTDKQIEHGVLYEDVNMDLTLNGQEKSRLSNTNRRIEFNKIQ
jgi:hypothetical protein